MASMTINGATITGNSIKISNGRIIVDGVDVTDQYDTGHSIKGISTGNINEENVQIGQNNVLKVGTNSKHDDEGNLIGFYVRPSKSFKDK